MKTRNAWLLIPALLLSAAVQAATVEKYNEAAFNQARARGVPLLLDVYADWCPVCKRQMRELTPLFTQPAQRATCLYLERRYPEGGVEVVSRQPTEYPEPLPQRPRGAA
ncbi:thioredoxin family protein [Edwardsiella hoshinae]|uniref:thioredoxin family protein n=1 Tax=Edwardsiella hoshinae TaxID=93378 RepID=UPI000A99C54C|nr:thioredoxin family protein [Edwardsiella hoshinae]